MPHNERTIADRIQHKLDELTRAERQLAHSMLENYPASCLGPLAAVAEEAGVSPPTVARMVQKVGYSSYVEFQAELREELKARTTSPHAKYEAWSEAAPSEHMLNRFTEAAIGNIRHTLAQIDPALFDTACQMVADPAHRLYIAGGRITHTLAEYLFLHMQVIRADVVHIQSSSNAWPHYLLDVKEGDIFIIFDVRRYENNTLKLAEMAHARGARLVLFTDQWRSPVHRLADISFSSRIAVPSAWDSAGAIMLLAETMIASVQHLRWGDTKDRIEELEQMFDGTRLFRKFT